MNLLVGGDSADVHRELPRTREPALGPTRLRSVSQRLPERPALRDVVVVSTSKDVESALLALLRGPAPRYRVLGYLSEGIVPGDAAPLAPHLGPPNQIDRVLAEHAIDEVVFALPLDREDTCFGKIFAACECQGVQLTLPLLPAATANRTARLHEINGVPVLHYGFHRLIGWRAAVKRALDFGAAIALLTLALPLLPVVALLIKWDSRGPVFFFQERVGYRKRPFKMVKLRTMVPTAESQLEALLPRNEASGPVFKMRDDPRITRLGRFLRRTSLDELPQLWNVLCGDMSLVGPRPLPLRDVQGFSEARARRRFSVKPGITCVWQVSGRSSVSFEEWIDLDLDYIENWSLALDFKILWRTLPAVLRGTGAH